MKHSLDEVINKSKGFTTQSNRAILLGKDDTRFVYEQLSERKIDLNNDLLIYAENRNTAEILRVSALVNRIQELMDRMN